MKRDLFVRGIGVIEAIPRRKIFLDHIITPGIFCGSMACAIGHLALDPEFSADTGLEVRFRDGWGTYLLIAGKPMYSYAAAGAKVFDISEYESRLLFRPRTGDPMAAPFWASDKRIWLERAHRLLAKHDALAAKQQADEAIARAAALKACSSSRMTAAA